MQQPHAGGVGEHGEPLGVVLGVGPVERAGRSAGSTALVIVVMPGAYLAFIDVCRYSLMHRQLSMNCSGGRRAAPPRHHRRRPDRAGRRRQRRLPRPAVRRARGRPRRPAPPWPRGRTSGCSRPGASWSTRSRTAPRRRPAGRRPTRTTTRPAREWREDYLAPLADLLAAHPGERSATTPVSPASPAPAATCSSTPAATTTCSRSTSRRRSVAQRLLAGAVVDASGTWPTPNPLGADGYPALGEREHADRISYGIPDLADARVAARYAGKHVVVAGKGASAQGVLIGLTHLARRDPATRVTWLLRRPDVGDAFGGGDNDQLEQRGRARPAGPRRGVRRSRHRRHPRSAPSRSSRRPMIGRPAHPGLRPTASGSPTSTRSSS